MNKLFLTLIVASGIMGTVAIVGYENQDAPEITVSLADVESITACEVSSNASANVGYCSPKLNTTGDACTTSGDPSSVRCSGNL